MPRSVTQCCGYVWNKYLSADLLLLHERLLLLLLLHVGRLLLLLHCGDLLLAAALVELVARLALLDGLGGLGADVDGADGLAVRVQRRARVLPLVARTDGVDLGEDRAFIVSVPVTFTYQLSCISELINPTCC